MQHTETKYEVQVQPTDSDLWILSGRFNTYGEAEAQAIESADQDRPMFRAYRILQIITNARVLPGEYTVRRG